MSTLHVNAVSQVDGLQVAPSLRQQFLRVLHRETECAEEIGVCTSCRELAAKLELAAGAFIGYRIGSVMQTAGADEFIQLERVRRAILADRTGLDS
jgi:hypothetical protein